MAEASETPVVARARRSRAKAANVWRENIESLLWAVALALLIRTFIMAPFKIPSGSMRPTLIEGDRILVNKFIYRFQTPKRGDIIVFRYPEDPKRPFIKRLAAVGGDTLEIRGGKVYVNNELLSAGAFATGRYYNQGSFGESGTPITVPAGHYFVLGDNSLSSHDSRFWGFVPKKHLIGQAMCIFWPFPRWRVLK
jgi:signal peptidase I